MGKIWNEIQYDLEFLGGHTLQPQWFKVVKVFILVGVGVGYHLLFGWLATLLFFAMFVLLMLGVHFAYRIKTKKYTTTWLDFVVYEQDGERKMKRIGKFYYGAIAVNALIAVIVSQVLT